jgi:protein gp37
VQSAAKDAQGVQVSGRGSRGAHALIPKISPVNDVVIAKRAPRGFISRVCDTMGGEHWHAYQVLTKRSFLMREFHKECHGGGRGPNHIWFGVSVEDSSKISRIRHLQESPVGVRFLSIEPLIGPMGRRNLTGID